MPEPCILEKGSLAQAGFEESPIAAPNYGDPNFEGEVV